MTNTVTIHGMSVALLRKEFGELNVYVDPNIDMYNDSDFLEQVRNELRDMGFSYEAAMAVDYSESGMSEIGEDDEWSRISFDVQKQFCIEVVDNKHFSEESNLTISYEEE